MIRTRWLAALPLVGLLAACQADTTINPLVATTLSSPSSALALVPCTFTTKGTTMRLTGDCVVDATVLVPDGMTLDGAGHSITAVDPAAGHFLGAVVQNGGTTAHVKNLLVSVDALANVCDPSSPTDTRLRGIMFEGASGTIRNVTVAGVNQGVSGCQEGNSIEVRNAPFDNTHPNTQSVIISHSTVLDWQKTGIVCNGDVTCSVEHNVVGASATQANLAANSVQFGFGASGNISHNRIAGNQWCGASVTVATAILLFSSEDVTVFSNTIDGNADVGIYEAGDGDVLRNNRLDDEGPDCNQAGYDIGIGNWGTNGTVTNNKVSTGFTNPYDSVLGGGNKLKPGPSVGQVFFK